MTFNTTRRKILKLSGTALGMSAMQSVAAARNAQSDILVERSSSEDVRIVNNSTDEQPVTIRVYKPGALESTYVTDDITLVGSNSPEHQGDDHVFQGTLDYEGDGSYYTVEADVPGSKATKTRVPVIANGLPKHQAITVNVGVDGTPRISTLQE